MKWWMLVGLGLFWCASVILLTFISLRGAEQAVADGLASAPVAAQTAVAWVSAIIFAGPGLVFLVWGWRKRPGAPTV